MALESGVRVGKYVVGRKLGQGGFGILHTARDTELDREVAIKFLRPEHAFKPQVVQRFLQEARAAARINHPGIVTVYESGIVGGTNTRADGTVYIAMELLAGETLAERLKRAGKLPVPVAVGLARQLAAALAAAHASSIVHRDLKPQNVFLVRDPAVVGGERLKVLDFGIAKLVDDFGSNIQTHSMLMLGTPMYMSPEQCRSSAKVDARSDIYALGCIMFELVCGRPPFDGDSGELIAKHQLVPPPTPRSVVATLPPELDGLVTSMLAKSPADRPQTMDAVLDALLPLDGGGGDDGPTLTDEPRDAPPPPAGPTTTLTEGAASRPSIERRSRRTLWLGAGAAIALGITVGVVSVHGSKTSDEAASAPAIGSASAPPKLEVAPDAVAAVAVAIDAGPSAPAPDDEAGALRVECLAYQTDKKWQDLQNCANRLASLDPTTAKTLADKGKAEQRNEVTAGRLDEAISQGDVATAKKLLDKIDDDSVYKKFAAEASAALARQGGGKPKAPIAKIVSGCDADALDEKARQEEALGQHAAALAKFEAAIACKPSDRRYQLAFMSACNASNYPKAHEYYKRVVGNRVNLAQMCVRNGIRLSDLEKP